MPKTYPEIENAIIVMLRGGSMKQVDIVDAFPLNRYMDVGNTVCDMDRRGIVTREKCGSTRMVTLAAGGEHAQEESKAE